MKVIPLDRQSLIDVAIQTSGSVEAAFALATRNGLSITDNLPSCEIFTVEPVCKIVVERYRSRGIRPATALEDSNTIPMPSAGGVGYMAIEIDFVVS
ncbi:MAG: hypothetical protein RR221_06875 [Alistipes sp.]